MENLNIIDIKKKIKDFSKNPKKNYNELVLLYQNLVVYYFYLKKTDNIL
jgi:hypothetical protein